MSTTSMSVPTMERVNMQLALDAFAEESARFDVIGLDGDIGNYGGVSLAGLATGSWHGPGEAARQHVKRPWIANSPVGNITRCCSSY